MAQLTFPVTSKGLEIPVWIGLDRKTTASLLAARQAISSPIQTNGLVDCGADLTAVASWVLQKLGIPVAAQRATHTAAGLIPVDLYEVSLSILDPKLAHGPMLTHGDVLVTEIKASLPGVDVLIGLNILLQHRLLLDGPARQFTLDF